MKDWKNTSPKARRQLSQLIDAGMAVCSKCGRAVTPGQLWDVDHRAPQDLYPELVHDPSNWAIAHRHCNRRAGAVYGNRKRGHEPRPPMQLPPSSRQW